jgi:hypothetical protein
MKNILWHRGTSFSIEVELSGNNSEENLFSQDKNEQLERISGNVF